MTVDRMLVVAPHPDDEVLGVGGTIAKFAAAGGEVTILIVAAHMPPLYTEETHKKTVSEANRAHALVGVKEKVFETIDEFESVECDYLIAYVPDIVWGDTLDILKNKL